MQIEGHTELSVLHQALMERHFIREWHSKELIGSPILAVLAHRILDELIEADVRRQGEEIRQRWRSWRRLDDSKGIVWDIFVERLREYRAFLSKASDDELIEFVGRVASPFVLEKTVLNSVIKQILGT